MKRDHMYYIWTPDWKCQGIDEVHSPEGWSQLALFSGEEIDIATPLLEFLISTEDITDSLVNHLSYLIFSPKLRKVIEELTNDPIQYLPTTIICSKTKKLIQDYTICNPLVQLEAIDKDTSSIEYGYGNSIIGIDRLVLNKDQISGHSFFRISEFFPILIVREDIAEGVIENGCTGVSFQPIEEFRV